MSKIKDQIEREKQSGYEEFIAFMEWVCDQEMSESETREEQEDTSVPSSPRTSIVHQNTLKPVNNKHYNPKLGA